MNSFGIMPVNFLNAAMNDDLEPSVKAMSSKVNRFLIIVVLTSVCKDNNNFINVAKNRWSMMVMPMISGARKTLAIPPRPHDLLLLLPGM